MKLSELQLDEALDAVAAFLTPSYEELSPWQQSEMKKKLVPWLVPIFLKLPETATATEVRDDVFQYEFLEAAQNFELRKLRENELYDNDTDEDLRKRIAPSAIETSAVNLAYLTAVALEAVAALPAEVQLAVVLQDLDSPLEDIQKTLEDPEALDAELAKVLD